MSEGLSLYDRIVSEAAEERTAERAEAKKERRSSEAHRIGKRNNLKGKRREREVAKLLGGERVPLSGALDGHPNDVILPNGWRTEVKARQSGLAFLYSWVDTADVVAFHEPGQPWLFGMTLERFKLWMGGAGIRRQTVTAAIAALGRGATKASIGKHLEMEGHERKGGFKAIRQWLAAENADALLFKADRKDWLVVMDEGHFRSLLSGATAIRISGGDGMVGADRR